MGKEVTFDGDLEYNIVCSSRSTFRQTESTNPELGSSRMTSRQTPNFVGSAFIICCSHPATQYLQKLIVMSCIHR